jgi:hypothetical protein
MSGNQKLLNKMECIVAYGGNNLLSLALMKVYQKYPAKFGGSGIAGAYKWAFDVKKAPTAVLVSGSSTHNLVITLAGAKIAVAQKNGGPTLLNKELVLKVKGKLSIGNSVLSLALQKIEIDKPGAIEAAVMAVINSQVLPKIKQALDAIQLPQLNKIFGSSLSAKLQSGKVIGGPAFETGIRMSGKSGIKAANALPADLIAALNSGSASNALVAGLVSGSAVNALMKELLGKLQESFNESAGKKGFYAGIKGTVHATTPVLNIENGVCRASTTLSFSGLKGGVKVPLIKWKWIKLPSPKLDVVVVNALSAKGNKGILELKGVSSIKVDFDWPKILKPVEKLAEKLVSKVLSRFKGKINNLVKGKKFELFSLPATIPGTNLGAKLSFDKNGLSYYKSSVRGLVRVKA